MRSVAVYCGSRSGNDPAYAQAAAALGAALARRGCAVVYGGSHAGLMGTVADAALAAGGRVIGVIPDSLVDRELAHQGLTRLEVVGSMHERKARMCELADAFVALPGGIGTLEEILEIFTWDQLGIHQKPCALLDIAGFYAPFAAFLHGIVERGLLRREQFERLIVAGDVDELLDAFTRRQTQPGSDPQSGPVAAAVSPRS